MALAYIFIYMEYATLWRISWLLAVVTSQTSREGAALLHYDDWPAAMHASHGAEAGVPARPPGPLAWMRRARTRQKHESQPSRRQPPPSLAPDPRSAARRRRLAVWRAACGRSSPASPVLERGPALFCSRPTRMRVDRGAICVGDRLRAVGRQRLRGAAAATARLAPRRRGSPPACAIRCRAPRQ